jgi:hypothetical protein
MTFRSSVRLIWVTVTLNGSGKFIKELEKFDNTAAMLVIGQQEDENPQTSRVSGFEVLISFISVSEYTVRFFEEMCSKRLIDTFTEVKGEELYNLMLNHQYDLTVN